jgi:hypothetical protein
MIHELEDSSYIEEPVLETIENSFSIDLIPKPEKQILKWRSGPHLMDSDHKVHDF